MNFDAASIAALSASLLARSLAGQFVLSTTSTGVAFVDNKVPGAELVRPQGPGPWTMVSVTATYRSPDAATPIPSTPGAPPHFDRAGGLQRSFGPQRLPGTSRTLDPLCFSIVCTSEPGQILIATGLLLDFLRMQFDRLDVQSRSGRAPVRFP